MTDKELREEVLKYWAACNTSTMPEEEQALRAWIKRNRLVLERHDFQVQVSFAKMNGFNHELIYRVFSEVGYLQGLTADNRAGLYILNFANACSQNAKTLAEMAKKSRPKELDLMPLWQDLVARTITGEAA